MKAGCAGGSTFAPVLFGEEFVGRAGSKCGPTALVAKSYLA